MKVWLYRQKLPAHVATVRGKERESSTDCIWEDTTIPFESCRSTDTNLLLASITKWEDMGCTPGTTPEYLLLLQTHEMQKPSNSQVLYPILLLALLALTTSAYTSLVVSQDLNSQCQLLEASVYYSATSAAWCRLEGVQREDMVVTTFYFTSHHWVQGGGQAGALQGWSGGTKAAPLNWLRKALETSPSLARKGRVSGRKPETH
jgi:hypothetical protein